ncbi:hypothetical protein, partial [Nocardioides sp.]|uniref:hypothetical protein n=1 Tax=Nocardioides sp. TaxID=35761 RepID=UPI00272B82C8
VAARVADRVSASRTLASLAPLRGACGVRVPKPLAFCYPARNGEASQARLAVACAATRPGGA